MLLLTTKIDTLRMILDAPLVPTFDGGDDFVWVCGPYEGLWIIVGLVEEPADGGLKFADGSEDAAFKPASGELGEKSFDGIEP